MLQLESWITGMLFTGLPKRRILAADYRTFSGDFFAADSLRVDGDSASDGSKCLTTLVWAPTEFVVNVSAADRFVDRMVLKFPSPKTDVDSRQLSDVDRGDTVFCDWFPSPSALASLGQDEAEGTRTPAVIVVHELGERMHVGRTIARAIQRMDLHAFLIHLPSYGYRRTLQGSRAPLTSLFEQAVADVRRAADAIACLPTVDAERISLQGTSLGGFIASLSASFDSRFECVFLCLAGADLHGILHEGNADARETRNRLAAAGLEGERMADALWHIEPARIASRLDPSRTWLYSGRYDRVVPLAFAKKLALAANLGNHHETFPIGHYTGFVCLPKLLKDIGKSLRRNS